MARPRYEQGDTQAKDKLASALWNMLDSEPFDKISVLELCRVAGVNKNTFYYHFDNLYELASYSIDTLLSYEAVSAMLALALPKTSTLMPLTSIAAAFDEDRRQKAKALMSNNGAALLPLFEDRIIAAWKSKLELVGAELNEDKDTLLAFAIGGAVNALRMHIFKGKPLNSEAISAMEDVITPFIQPIINSLVNG